MVAIIDYKAGNAQSVLRAASYLGHRAEIIAAPSMLRQASRIILPGVGNADAAMRALKESGMVDALGACVIGNHIPFLGICVGMQILFEHSGEGDAECLGWLKGRVEKFDCARARVPQMGWNAVHFVKPTPLAAVDSHFYFVNSYYARPQNAADVWGVSDYGGSFTAAVQNGNIYGTQFHAEKSGRVGLAFLREFLSGGGTC